MSRLENTRKEAEQIARRLRDLANTIKPSKSDEEDLLIRALDGAATAVECALYLEEWRR
jgi:RNase P protein component